MLRDRFRQWGINDKNRKRHASKGRRSKAALAHKDDGQHHKDGFVDDSDEHRYAIVSPGLPKPIEQLKHTRLLQQVLKSVRDWQKYFMDSGANRGEVASATVWLRVRLRSMRWAMHCLENGAAQTESDLAFKRIREASIVLRNNFEAKFTPPAVLMCMSTLLNLGFLDGRPSSVQYNTARKFFVQMAAEILPPTHPTVLLLRLLLCEQIPETLAALHRIGPGVIGQCFGADSRAIWTSQMDLTNTAAREGMNARLRLVSDKVNDGYLTASCAEHATNRTLSYASRLHSLSQSYTQPSDNLKEAYGAYQLLAASQHWLSDAEGEEMSLQNAVHLAKIMESTADVQPGELSFEMMEAIQELNCCYENHGKAQQSAMLRLEYPRVFRGWDGEK